MQLPSRGKILLCFFILGIMSLSYLLGAAVMVFELPSSGFLRKAFDGGRAWGEPKQVSRFPAKKFLPAPSGKGDFGNIDIPEKTFDGFTLLMVASMSAPSTQAFLLDMSG